MYKKYTTEISVRHQKQVEQGLLELMGTLPYGDITVTSLCQHAGVSRRVFYHLFGSKNDALYALIDHTLLGIESYRTDLADEILRFCLYWRGQGALLDALERNGLSSLLLERMVATVLNEDFDLRYWVRDYDRQTGSDIILFYLCGIMGLTYGWHHSGYQRSPQEMASRILQLIHPSSKSPKN